MALFTLVIVQSQDELLKKKYHISLVRMPFVTFQNVILQHYESCEHTYFFSIKRTIHEDLGMNGLSLIQYKYWHGSHEGNYVKPHIFDPCSGSH